MKMQPLDIADGAYRDEDLTFSAQDTCNYLPNSAEQAGARSPTMLKTPPGLKPSVLIGVNDSVGGMQVSGPVRGSYNAEGRMFVVAGDTLWNIMTAGVSVPLGTVPGVGRVSFSHNQITNGNEVLVNNGNAGYVYNTVTQVFQRITDTSYPGGLRAGFLNNRFIQIEPKRRYAFPSALADGLGYNALDRFTSEVSPDLLVGQEVSNNELLLFSTTTGEFYEDTGANPQPIRSKQIVMQRGLAGPYASATLDNTILFLGDDGSFYRLDGYHPVRISTKPIEQSIRGKNWWNCFTTIWQDAGFKVCYWTFPDGYTWGFDVSTNKWHRRESYGFSRWRINSLTNWNGKWYAGDFQAGKLYELDWNYILEGSDEFISYRSGGVLSDNQNRVLHKRLELVVDTGREETLPIEFEDQPVGPQISGDAPYGIVGEAYSGYSYAVTSGDSPVASVVVVSGALPEGLSLSNSGVVSMGTPSAEGTSTFRIRVTDQNGLWAELTDTIVIYEIHGGDVACGTDHTASGGVDFPYTKWILMNPSHGNVLVSWDFGIPDKAEVWIDGILRYTTGYRGLVSEQGNLNSWLDEYDTPRETVNPDDPGSATFYKSSSNIEAELRVYGPIPATLWEVNVGCPDSSVPAAALAMSGQCPDPLINYTTPFAYATTGGVEPYTFSLQSGSLPTGRALDPTTGVISGTYTATGTFNYTVRVTDSVGAHVDVSDTVQVYGAYP